MVAIFILMIAKDLECLAIFLFMTMTVVRLIKTLGACYLEK